jgi:hypothetical protein
VLKLRTIHYKGRNISLGVAEGGRESGKRESDFGMKDEGSADQVAVRYLW